MFKLLIPIIIVGSFILIISCESSTSPVPKELNYDDLIEYSVDKLLKSVEEIPNNSYPWRTRGLGNWELKSSSEWVSGFFPGCLWYANKLAPDSTLLKSAIRFTEGLFDQQFTTNSHDVGFIILNSYGNGYEQTNNEQYKNIVLQAANSLATRFNPNVGCIQSWDGEYIVIVDNMMNLEILFWAAKHGGSQDLYNIAVSHADKTAENHIRENGSSFHVVKYNPENGSVIEKRTHAGYSDSSTWARGQAWGIYGFTMCYRETNDNKYLETAIKMADYYIDNLPSDDIPFWDFNLPANYDKKYKDASAATISLSAFLELRNYVDNKSKYDNVINRIFNSLFHNYVSYNTNSSGIINHCAYYLKSDNPYDWDASTIWGDYYFIESLVRYTIKK